VGGRACDSASEECVLVNTRAIASVLGKGGADLKAIAASSRAKIAVRSIHHLVTREREEWGLRIVLSCVKLLCVVGGWCVGVRDGHRRHQGNTHSINHTVTHTLRHTIIEAMLWCYYASCFACCV
jgi:hypothetical protein